MHFLPRAALITVIAGLVAVPESGQGEGVKLIVRNGYLPDIPVLVRVELRTAAGRFDRSVWDAEAVLAVDQAGVAPVPDRVTLRNGCGSALVMFAGGGDFTLTATVGEQSASRSLHSLSNEPITAVSGVLSGEETEWSGVVRLTDDVTVPAGHTLTVHSNTLVLIDGVDSGRTAPDLFVKGRILSQGTETHPVTFTCSDPALRWGQIDHDGAEPSVYRYTVITRAGRAAGEGHTGQGPAIDVSNSEVAFENCSITDHAEISPSAPGFGQPGKIMQANGSELVFEECLLSRSRMGPEISGTGIRFSDSYIIDMRGDDDADAIYIHSQGAGQEATLTRAVVAGTDDDGVDTLGSRVTVHDCLVRDTFDKGMSFLGAELNVSHCLSANCGIGLSSKANDGSTIITRIWNSTIVGKNRGIAAENKGGGAPDATVLYFVTNSIIQATDRPEWTVYTDYDPLNMAISFSDTVSTNWPGEGNISLAPLFVDGVADFRLTAESPCVDMGDPLSPLDPDGTRADMGVFPLRQAVAGIRLLQPALLEGLCQFVVTGEPGQVYEIERTTRFDEWLQVAKGTNIEGQVLFRIPLAPGENAGFYRALLVP